ncbi:MAG: T9SS type A sorting domain-containing protein [bacterium]
MNQSQTSLMTLLIVAMATNQAMPQTVGKLEGFGLPGKRVTALALAQHLGPPSSFLYAVTENEGVYRRSLDPPDTTWQDLGLKGKNLTALDIQIWGAGPSIYHAPVVGVLPDRGTGDSTLVYRLEGAQWIPADSGIARAEVYSVKALESIESAGHAPPGDAFAGGSGLIYRSKTFSRWWQEAYNGGVGVTNAIATSGMVFMSGAVWAGGETTVFAPWIAKSNDGGESWEVSYPDLKGDNACNSLAIHSLSSNVVYAGMEGAVIKTTDAGKTWDYTGLRDTPVYFYGLALDPRDLDHVYAGGLIANPNNWALWESFDAGLHWREIPPPALVTPVVVSGITSIVADRYTANVIYLATLGHGVWKYQSQTTTVEDGPGWAAPENFALDQNYPNPFNPETVIRYRLSSPQHVRLEVYNLQGKLIATLANQMQTPGEHSVRWDAREASGQLAPPGIYFYRLSVGAKRTATRKMILLW